MIGDIGRDDVNMKEIDDNMDEFEYYDYGTK